METREYEIDLREYFQIIRKRIWVIVLIIVLSVGISGSISFFILEPVYETYTTLMVSRPSDQDNNIQYQDVLLSQKLVKTYGEIVKSRAISKQVIYNLNLNLTSEQLKGKIEVSPVKDTEIIQIKVSDKNPQLATNIANELAKVFMKDVKVIMKVDNVQVIDKAEIPYIPVKPKPMLNIAIAGFLGLMVGLGIVFLLEYLDNTIKTPSDVERYLDLPVIGVIPEFNQK